MEMAPHSQKTPGAVDQRDEIQEDAWERTCMEPWKKWVSKAGKDANGNGTTFTQNSCLDQRADIHEFT
jgi:hypothetical protein